jgi:hypothetical protein
MTRHTPQTEAFQVSLAIAETYEAAFVGAAEVEDAVELVDSELRDIRDLEGGMDDV